jgi:hypothetical protein
VITTALKLWEFEVTVKGPAPLAPVKVTVEVEGVKVVRFQFPPTVMAAAAEAVSPAPVRLPPTLRL